MNRNYAESQLSFDHLVQHGPFRIDFENRLVQKQDGSIEHLSPLELTVLMRLTDNFLSQEELTRRIGSQAGLQTTTLDGMIESDDHFVLDPGEVTPLQFTKVHLREVIKTLRKKLGPAIENKFGRGYRLVNP